MSNAMNAIIRAPFPNAAIVTDRFHVQQLISEVVQEIRIAHRREALQEETAAILAAQKEKRIYQPTLYENGDTKKQLLARSHYVYSNTEANGRHGNKHERPFYSGSFPSFIMPTICR